jgi:hypothetical protein
MNGATWKINSIADLKHAWWLAFYSQGQFAIYNRITLITKMPMEFVAREVSRGRAIHYWGISIT